MTRHRILKDGCGRQRKVTGTCMRPTSRQQTLFAITKSLGSFEVTYNVTSHGTDYDCPDFVILTRVYFAKSVAIKSHQKQATAV